MAWFRKNKSNSDGDDNRWRYLLIYCVYLSLSCFQLFVWLLNLRNNFRDNKRLLSGDLMTQLTPSLALIILWTNNELAALFEIRYLISSRKEINSRRFSFARSLLYLSWQQERSWFLLSSLSPVMSNTLKKREGKILHN